VEAASWEELVAKEKPTFTWGNPGFQTERGMPSDGFPDMMWIEGGADGKPVFRLERAYTWKPAADEKVRWVLVELVEHDNGIIVDNFFHEQIAGRMFPIRVNVTDEISGDPDRRWFADYAIVRGSDPRGGTVYEIGWSQNIASGMGRWISCRQIYVWRDMNGVWRLLGEGLGESGGKTGPEYHNCSCEVNVEWRGELPHPVRPRVGFVLVEWNSETGEDATMPDLVLYRDSVLDGASDRLPVALKGSGAEYMRAEKGDTLEKVALRLAVWDEIKMKDSKDYFYWDPRKDKPSAELLRWREKYLQFCRDELLRLNPQLSGNMSDELVEGTQVYIRK